MKPVLGWILATATLIQFGSAGTVRAETLDYDILIDGTRSGFLFRTVTRNSDASTRIDTRASMVFRFLFLSFRYSFQGSETWREGRFLSAVGECDDNGTRHSVSWNATPSGGTVSRNGKTMHLERAPWPTSAFAPPTGEGTHQTLDPDTGLLRMTSMFKSGQDTIFLDGKPVAATVWKTDLPGEARFWFANDGTLLRQSWREQGRTIDIRIRRAGGN
ncbi:MAG: hypothetical protein KJS91_07535 [Planctomycetes bacterium]|nr:hypothetical protein [Planctomycetota bacterium]